MIIYSDKANPMSIAGRHFALAGLEGNARKGIELYITGRGGTVDEILDGETDCLIYRPGYPGYGENTEKYLRAKQLGKERVTALEMELREGKELNFARRASFEKYELAQAYLRDECEFAPEQTALIRAYAAANSESLLKLSFKNDDAAMAERLLELSFSGEAAYLDTLIEKAADEGCTKLTAFLLNFKAAHFTPQELAEAGDEEMQKELGFMERSEEEWRRRFRYEKCADGICVTGSLMLSDTAEIPAFIAGLPVTRVGGMSVGHRTDIRRVILPPTVKLINNHAFNGCAGLTEVSLNRGLQSIGRGAFQQCTALRSVKLPETLEKIESTAFFGCEKLLTLNIPERVKEIGNFAFFGCKNLTLGVKAGSYAEGYAKDNNLDYEII